MEPLVLEELLRLTSQCEEFSVMVSTGQKDLLLRLKTSCIEDNSCNVEEHDFWCHYLQHDAACPQVSSVWCMAMNEVANMGNDWMSH